MSFELRAASKVRYRRFPDTKEKLNLSLAIHSSPLEACIGNLWICAGHCI